VQDETKRAPNLGLSLIPVIVLIGTLFYTIVILEGTGHIPLIIGAITAALIAGYSLG